MKKKTKIIMIISSVVMISLALFIILTREVPSTSSASSQIRFDDVTVDNLRFSNAILKNNELTAIVQNTTGNNYPLKTIDVKFIDNSGSTITTIKGYLGESLSSNEYRNLSVKTDIDLSSTKTITYIINK